MNPRRTGAFTLVELMIVITIVSVIAAIALPNLVESRKRSNESSAVKTLQAIAVAQALFRESAQGPGGTPTYTYVSGNPVTGDNGFPGYPKTLIESGLMPGLTPIGASATTYGIAEK